MLLVLVITFGNKSVECCFFSVREGSIDSAKWKMLPLVSHLECRYFYVLAII